VWRTFTFLFASGLDIGSDLTLEGTQLESMGQVVGVGGALRLRDNSALRDTRRSSRSGRARGRRQPRARQRVVLPRRRELRAV